MLHGVFPTSFGLPSTRYQTEAVIFLCVQAEVLYKMLHTIPTRWLPSATAPRGKKFITRHGFTSGSRLSAKYRLALRLA